MFDHSRTSRIPAHRIEFSMSEIKQPQDHKKPVTGFEFEAPVTNASGETVVKKFTLPLVTKGRAKMSGRDLRDAAMDGEAGQVIFMFKVLEASEPSEAALNALYDLPSDDTLEILNAWGNFGDGDGASLGK